MAPANRSADDTTEVDRLRKENATLRRKLAEATADDKATKEPHVPDWLPEGTRQDLEANGRAVNPFNGEKLGDWPEEK